MTITKQITSQIDGVVSSIQQYCSAIQQENQRTTKAKADAATRCANQKVLIQQNADNECETCDKILDAFYLIYNAQYRDVENFERELNRIYSRKWLGNIPKAPDNSFSQTDAQQLIHRIKETGLLVSLMKLFSFGGYKTNRAMAAELYGKIDSFYDFYERRSNEEEKERKDGIQRAQQTAKKKIAAADAQYKQDIENENKVHAAKIRALAQMEQKIVADPRIPAIQKLLSSSIGTLGAKPDGWQNYTPSKAIPNDLLIGVILYPCSISAPSADALRLLKRISGYDPTVNGFTVPLTISTDTPVMMYSCCDAGDVSLAASVYQSIIARMIRFMPPKSFRSVFFDPINRSTSLGQLIHLAGDGSSQLCEYHLSPQEINTKMHQLTDHVDKICQKLTTSGCANIKAYNAIPNVARIPYTAVVIHDYPNGFDSNSLGCLQVLINKAEQCGISIMISQKQSDAVEHKAKEIKNLMEQKCMYLTISYQKKATLSHSGRSFSYKPNLVKLAPAYLDDINKLFTYKVTIDNSFSALFGGKTPAYRDSTKGLDIPFAIDSNGAVVDLRIGYDLSAYGFISGGVGSGKTTLLHMVIASAIMHYTPADLELWLIDYKEAEFAFYTRNCPPHVRYVVADNSSEISYSILDEIEAEIDRRKKAFIKAHVKDFAEYRESAYGKTHTMPRLMILVDEFHRMSQAAQEETEYKILLENIFAEARSHGVVLLLCDQQISNGLGGLSQKSRDLISVRIALRNKADEIRETLAAESAQLTDDVKKLILDTSAGVKGTALYKYEEKDKKDEFSNKVVFRSCRGIYASTDDRTKLIGQICQQYPRFDRDQTFFSGAVRQNMDVRQIQSFEKQYPQNPDAGERFYIGTPLGIQPCFYFNLKSAESGENVLLVGNNHEKRIAIIQATLACAARYGYTVKILASKACLLYRQNKEFFNSIINAEVITSFPQICKYVGEKANQLKNLYSDEEDFEIEETGSGKELVIFVGLDEIYSQMEASPLSQTAAWTVLTPDATPSTSVVTAVATPPTVVDTPPATPEAAAPITDPTLAVSMTDINSILARLASDEEDEEDTSVTMSMEEKFAGPETSGIKGYNAVKDLGLLFSDGWKIGINSMVVVDRGTAFKKMYQIKLDGNFNHRIALVMSPDEAQGFMSRTKMMKTLIDDNDSISAVYEYLGGREQCFRPYTFD